MTGRDVRELNHDLVRAGVCQYSGAIAAAGLGLLRSGRPRYALEQLQGSWGCPAATGKLPLGQAVFEPSARCGSPPVTAVALGVAATAGADLDGDLRPAGGGDRLDASQQAEVKAGDKVTDHAADGTHHAGGGLLGGQGRHHDAILGHRHGAMSR